MFSAARGRSDDAARSRRVKSNDQDYVSTNAASTISGTAEVSLATVSPTDMMTLMTGRSFCSCRGSKLNRIDRAVKSLSTRLCVKTMVELRAKMRATSPIFAVVTRPQR